MATVGNPCTLIALQNAVQFEAAIRDGHGVVAVIQQRKNIDNETILCRRLTNGMC